MRTGEDKNSMILKRRGRNPLMINNLNFLKRCNSRQSSICDFALCFVGKVLGRCGTLGMRTLYNAAVNWREREQYVTDGMMCKDGGACTGICAPTYYIRSKKQAIREK